MQIPVQGLAVASDMLVKSRYRGETTLYGHRFYFVSLFSMRWLSIFEAQQHVIINLDRMKMSVTFFISMPEILSFQPESEQSDCQS